MQKALVIIFLLLISAQAHAEEAVEKQKIEKLIASIENLQDASFIRNGKSYDAKTAGAFLRAKWPADIKTAADFIEKAATKSSTTGQAYIIRFKDGTEKPCADFLREQLKKLEQ